MHSVISLFLWGIFLIDVLESPLIIFPGWHCVTFSCAFSNNHLWPSSKQQKHNSWVFTVSYLSCLLIFLNMSHCQTYALFHKSRSIPKQCLHNMFSNQITCLFPGTHKLFHEPRFDILPPLLFTPSVFVQMVFFSFHKSIFDIFSALSLATYFLVPDIMSYLLILKQFPFSFISS